MYAWALYNGNGNHYLLIKAKLSAWGCCCYLRLCMSRGAYRMLYFTNFISHYRNLVLLFQPLQCNGAFSEADLWRLEGRGEGRACSWTFAWPEGAWDLNCGQYLGGDSVILLPNRQYRSTNERRAAQLMMCFHLLFYCQKLDLLVILILTISFYSLRERKS